MSYRVLPTKEFAKDFGKIEKKLQYQIKSKVDEVAQDPTRYKQLHYDLSGSCRLRVGKLRVIFSYDVPKKELYLEKVVFGHNY